MQSSPASIVQPDAARRVRRSAGVLLLAAVFSHSAIAATDNFIDCDRLASDLRSLDVPAEEFPAADANHVADASSAELSVRLDTENNDPVAPVLLLTPRVATILREVFKANVPADTDKAPVTTDADKTEKPTAATPPLVNAPRSELPDSSLAGDRNENSRYVPRFQRQMYRTDI